MWRSELYLLGRCHWLRVYAGPGTWCWPLLASYSQIRHPNLISFRFVIIFYFANSGGFEIASHCIAQAGLDITVWSRLALNCGSPTVSASQGLGWWLCTATAGPIVYFVHTGLEGLLHGASGYRNLLEHFRPGSGNIGQAYVWGWNQGEGREWLYHGCGTQDEQPVGALARVLDWEGRKCWLLVTLGPSCYKGRCHLLSILWLKS